MLTWLYRVATNVAIDRLRSAPGGVPKVALEHACTFERDEENEFACAPKVDGLVSLDRRR